MSEEVNVLGAAQVLAEILHSDPQALDKEAFKHGDQFLVIYSDVNFGRNTKGFSEHKIDVIKKAIDDLSSRGKLLSQAYLGVTFVGNKLETFLSQYGEAPTGNVVFKVGIKNTAAFMSWRNGAFEEITEADINSAIYRLTAEWARCL